MKFLTLTIFFVVTCFWIKVAAQQNRVYKEMLSTRSKNKTVVRSSEEDTTWRTYLGELTNSKNKPSFYVIKEFSKIKAAMTWHGHSNVYFFDLKGKMLAKFDVGFPGNLPVRLHKNSLFFPDDKIAGKLHEVKIGDVLPKTICIRPGWCDEVISL